MQVEHPVWCGHAPACHFHATLAGMLIPMLIGDQVIEVRQASQKRLLTPLVMMKPLHHEQLPVDGVVGLIQQGARHGHLGVCKHSIPALNGCTLKLPIRLGQGRGTGLLRIAQVPDDPTTDDRGQLHLLRETVAVFFVGQAIAGSGSPPRVSTATRLWWPKAHTRR